MKSIYLLSICLSLSLLLRMVAPNGENVCNWRTWVNVLKEFYVLSFRISITDELYIYIKLSRFFYTFFPFEWHGIQVNAGLQLWKGEVKQLTEGDTDHMVQRWVFAVILAHDVMGQQPGLPHVLHPNQSQWWKKKQREVGESTQTNKTLRTSRFKDVEKREPLCTVAGNVSWGSHCGKQYRGSWKNQNYHMIQQFHSWLFFQRKQKHSFEKIDAHQCLLKHCLQ